MSLDLYTAHIPLTQKASFWSNFVSSLKGSQDLRAPEEPRVRTWHPSIVETLPNDFPDLKHEFGKLESQMFDRIFTVGYSYLPVHTEIYGTYRAQTARMS